MPQFMSLTRFLVIIICLLVLQITTCHAAPPVPPCSPQVPYTEQKLAPIDWHTELGATGAHLYWACEDTITGKITWWGMVCSYANDCAGQAFMSFLTSLSITPDHKKALLARAAWLATVVYDCDNKTEVKTTWQTAVCKEHNDTFTLKGPSWAASLPTVVPNPGTAVVSASTIYLYCGTNYSGTAGFDTMQKCVDYAQAKNLSQTCTCDTKTTVITTHH